MSVSCYTLCVTCNEQDQGLGDGGMMGTPDLSVDKDFNEDWGVTTYRFGWFLDGLKSIDLMPAEVDAYRQFLEKHRGHELFLGNDHMSESEMPALDHEATTRFSAERAPLTAGRYQLVAETSGDVFRTTYDGEPFVAFTERRLSADEVDNFLTRFTADECFDSISRTTPSVEPYEDLGNLVEFVQAHRDEALTASLLPRAAS